MRRVKVRIRTVLDAAFDDTLDYWFLSLPAVGSALIGAVTIPFLVQRGDALAPGPHKEAIAAGLVFVALVVGVLLNLSTNFIIVAAWNDRESGRSALSRAAFALWRSAWRCVWTYVVWFGTYVAYVVVFTAVYVGFVVAKMLIPASAILVFVYGCLAVAALYAVWRFLRFMLSALYLDIVLALTEHGGRRAVSDSIAATKKRFWLTCLLVIITYVPSLLPDLFAMKTDWRLHAFITCIMGGFFAVFGTLVTVYVYSAPRSAAEHVPAREPDVTASSAMAPV